MSAMRSLCDGTAGDSSRAQKGGSTAGGEGAEFAQRVGFLYKSLDDNQNVIRFLDAKAAFAIALLSAMTGKVLADLPWYFPLSSQPLWRKALLCCFWGVAVLAAYLVFRVVFPVSNPSENVNLVADSCRPQFFIWELDPRSWLRLWSRAPRFSTLKLDQQVFVDEVKGATEDSLLVCLTGEVLKVSYIRQIKTDRLRVLGWFLLAASALFVMLVTAQSLAPKISGPQRVQVEGTVEVHDNASDQKVSAGTQTKNSSRSSLRRGMPSRKRD